MDSTIVVGVSGSRASLAALRWAAEEASRRRGHLLVVLAWHPEQLAPYALPALPKDPVWQRQDADRALAAVLAEAFGQELPEGLVSEVVQDMAERALVNRSASADMLVLGSTSSPTVVGRSIGPVIRSCLSRAHCPVVVIGPEGLAGDHEADDARTSLVDA